MANNQQDTPPNLFSHTPDSSITHFAKELDKIRVYDLVLIDEFQDFNKLEVELVNVLEARNKLVIVGDDDQAIYSFRGANPQYLREKYHSDKYINFTLPFCCRCTQVIVDAVNTIVEKANVKERIAKEYRCYLPEKKEDSIAYKKIMHKHFTVQGRQRTTNYMGKFISHFYKRIEASEKENARRQRKTLILIIGPRHYLDQIYPLLVEEVGEENISYRKSKQAKKLIVALKLIKADRNSNLGWRLIAEEKLSSSELNALIKQSISDNFLEIIPSELEKTVTNVLILLDQKEYHQEAVQEFLKLHEISQIEMLWDTQDQNKLFEDDEYSQIKLATFEGSKGLAADYVFITGLQEGVLPKTNNATEAEICKFIVALTRTRKQCYIFTCGRFSGTLQKKSFFLNWISEYLFYEKIDKSKINDYQ
ncbi:UvrD-helicase domain-containing protein [Legionella feeleii]|uniref:UvrD-helicase domain-containing protein n=1 Tax=Legionella feeleii TaxID=453 RepID=UPI001C498B32|nr:UvrD-helicase domain-containing protein [Legionella feeleii]